MNHPVRHTDWDYEKTHRNASECLIAATDSAIEQDQALALLDEAETLGKQALLEAGNVRQLVLEIGFLQTITAMRLAIERDMKVDLQGLTK